MKKEKNLDEAKKKTLCLFTLLNIVITTGENNITLIDNFLELDWVSYTASVLSTTESNPKVTLAPNAGVCVAVSQWKWNKTKKNWNEEKCVERHTHTHTRKMKSRTPKSQAKLLMTYLVCSCFVFIPSIEWHSKRWRMNKCVHACLCVSNRFLFSTFKPSNFFHDTHTHLDINR